MSNTVAAEIVHRDYPDLCRDSQRQYRQVFEQRADHALRDFETGLVDGAPIKLDAREIWPPAAADGVGGVPYVAAERLEGLRSIASSQFDLAKLVRLCEELNTSFAAGNYYSTMMLVRAVLDHVPPIFGVSNFAEVRAQHGDRSFKGTMDHLDNSLRNIADSALHRQARRREVLPTATQVDFRPALDVLLGEVEVELR